MRGQRLTIKQCQEVARSKGGECLSDEYKNNSTKMSWRCSENHEWEARFVDIKNGHWCACCNGCAKNTIEECHKYAENKGGECLSTEYKNSHTKMKWKCSENHEWDANFHNIKNHRHWCPCCGGSKRLTIEECQEHAKNKGGECLSTEYKNCETKMKWKCSENHEWEAKFTNIKIGKNWCPRCSALRSEKLACDILENETNYKWNKIRPDWLENLELDGYCEELNLAFEYQGIQHYQLHSHFHRNGIEDFHKQQEHDERKLRITLERGIKIIFIPYHFNYKNPDEMKIYLKDQLLIMKLLDKL